MESRFRADEAALAGEELAGQPALGALLYAARLMGANPSLSLHRAGTASHKQRGRDVFGEEVDLLHVTEADSDLRTATSSGLTVCRLTTLQRAARSEGASEDALVVVLRSSLIGRGTTLPDADALLHAVVPAPVVLQARPDVILRHVLQPDAARHCERVFGPQVLLVPYAAAGIALAAAASQSWEDFVAKHQREPEALLLQKRGLVTWGANARDAYEQMIGMIARAKKAVGGELDPVSAAEHRGEEQDEARRTVALAVRGAMRRASQRNWLALWRTSARLLRFSRRGDARQMCHRVCAVPDWVRSIGRTPLMLSDLGGGSPEAIAAVVDEALTAHVAAHAAYLERGRARAGSFGGTERFPRVVVVEDLGVLTLGATAEQAIRAADIFEHAVEVVDEAMALGGCVEPDAKELLDAEFGAAATMASSDDTQRGPLHGQIALVTGAASGIGQATSRALLVAGAHVLMTDRDPRVLDAAVEWPQQHFPGRFASCACDVASEVACRSAVEAACDAFGGIDVLVSNAGTAPSGVLHGASGDAALRSSLDINLLGHQRVARAAALAMIAQGSGGALLFNASKIAFHQGPGFGPYAVPKAALIALMRQYAVDLGAHGIRANAINADRIRTKMFAQPGPDAAAAAPALSPSAYFRANLLQRETTPEQVADAFVFLATAGATTGCIITVDGGNPAAFPR